MGPLPWELEAEEAKQPLVSEAVKQGWAADGASNCCNGDSDHGGGLAMAVAATAAAAAAAAASSGAIVGSGALLFPPREYAPLWGQSKAPVPEEEPLSAADYQLLLETVAAQRQQERREGTSPVSELGLLGCLNPFVGFVKLRALRAACFSVHLFIMPSNCSKSPNT